ncbi:MAG: glycosyltransferase family 4 protein [candidate division Zixibacteria bacterium]|nr:glycosyltransferase family 4 protein [candidate division Zixibacteria bacterium]
MKIAFIGQKGIPASWGGVEDFVEQVSVRLAGQGHAVTVYCRSYYTKVAGDYKGVTLKTLPSLNTKHWDALSHTVLSGLHSLLKDYDILHYQALGPSSLSAIPKIFGKSKIIATIHSLDWQRDKWGGLAKRIFRLAERPAAIFPDQLTAVSEGLRDYLQQKFDRPVVRISTGISQPNIREPEGINRYGLKPNQFLLYLGRLVPEKGCHLLCQAFQKLDPDLKLFIGGEGQFAGSYVESLKKYASDKIVFGGYVDQTLKEELFSNCLGFILPSLVEGFPNTILEAFSYGKPVLASDISANKEALGPFQLTFKSENKEDLVGALVHLLKTEPSGNGWPDKRMEYVRKNFSWDNTALQLEKIYEQALKG